MKCGVVVFPGSNCDHDAYHVLRHVLEQDVDLRWPDQYLAGKEQLERHRRRPAGMVIDI